MIAATTASTATSTSTLGGTNTTASTTDVAQDRFLKLLVAQLNNQDPMNPMDNAQMTSQMAQINTVTGIQQVNDTLKSMAEQFTAMQVLQGSSMVGHDVLIEGNTLTIEDNKAGGAIDLVGSADLLKVDILSPAGQILDTLNLGAAGTGRHSFEWNASGYQGTGNPSFKVTATQAGKAIETSSLSRDKVVSVGSDAGAMTMQLRGLGVVAYNNIRSIL